jgi:hypothetical protein
MTAKTAEPNPFDPNGAKPQDIKQVWFSGVHADIGGGYPEIESGPAKYPLGWLIDEAVHYGLEVNMSMYNHLVLGARVQVAAMLHQASGRSCTIR